MPYPCFSYKFLYAQSLALFEFWPPTSPPLGLTLQYIFLPMNDFMQSGTQISLTFVHSIAGILFYKIEFYHLQDTNTNLVSKQNASLAPKIILSQDPIKISQAKHRSIAHASNAPHKRLNKFTNVDYARATQRSTCS